MVAFPQTQWAAVMTHWSDRTMAPQLYWWSLVSRAWTERTVLIRNFSWTEPWSVLLNRWSYNKTYLPWTVSFGAGLSINNPRGKLNQRSSTDDVFWTREMIRFPSYCTDTNVHTTLENLSRRWPKKCWVCMAFIAGITRRCYLLPVRANVWLVSKSGVKVWSWLVAEGVRGF